MRTATATQDTWAEQLGEALVADGKLTAEQRDWAMPARERAGTNLTVILISSGLVRRVDLFKTLAELTRVCCLRRTGSRCGST